MVAGKDGALILFAPESEPGVCVHLHHGTFTVHMTFSPVCTFLTIINVDGETAEAIQNGGQNTNQPKPG